MGRVAASYLRGVWGRTALLAALTVACGEDPAPPPAPPPPPEPALDEAFALDLEALREGTNALGAAAQSAEGTPDGVARARRAAALARVLSVRDPDGPWLERGRAWLLEASRRKTLAGACDAALELAALEARDAVDPGAAYLVAYRITRRFEEEACVAEARRMMQVLEAWRPSAGQLARIDADPDEGDPTAGLDGTAPPAPNGAPDLAAWAAERAETGARSSLTSLTVYGHGDGDAARSVRAVLRFDRVVAFEHGEAAAEGAMPRRTWFELSGVAFGEGVADALAVDAGGLRRIRSVERDGGARVTFDLDPEARFHAFVLPDPFRIVLDVEEGGPRAEGPVRRIVLDPGHGGDDFGARSFGMRESDLTLDLARRVRTLLARRLPDAQVVLTRENDTFISLEQRAAIANSIGADLFLSIHLNAADDEVERGGVTTFVLDTSDDRQALRLAARENGTTVDEVDSLARLLAQLHRSDQVAASRDVAGQVHRATLEAGRRHLPSLHDRGVKSALFYVLVGARMPAVLLEASFLSRRQEADLLRETPYRQSLAEGIAEGIVRWAE